MRALRTLAISASVFLIPSFALADFQTTGAAPVSTLPAFQAQATPSATATASIANPSNYYGAQNNLQPDYAQPKAYTQAQYSMTPLANNATGNGADPGVGPVTVDGNGVASASIQPTIIEGKKSSVEFKQVGYGYAPVTQDTTPATTTAPMASAPVYGTTPATYATSGQQPSAMMAQPQPYGAYPQAQATYAPQGYAPYSPQAPAASGYGMSGYAPNYGAPSYAAPQPQTNPGMLNNGTTTGSYGTSYNSTYASPNADTQNYTGTPPSPAYGSQGYTGSYGAGVYPSAQQPAAPAYGTSSGAYPGYGAQYNATPTPQPAYGAGNQGYGGGYGGYAPQPQYAPAPQAYAPAPQAYAPQPQYQQYAPPAPAPQPDYGNQGYGGYAPYNAAPPPSSSMDATQPRYSNMNYQGTSRSAWGDDSPSLAAVPNNKGRLYAALRTGIGFPKDNSRDTTLLHFDTSYDTSWQVGGALGWEAPSIFGGIITPRSELELNYQQQSVDKQKVNGVEISNPDAFGETDTLRVFANGYFDFNTPWRRWFTPYIGGGVGLGYVDFDRHGTTPTGVNLSDSAIGFAWNAGAGLSFPIMNKNTNLDVGYRYSQVTGIEFEATDGTKSKADVGGHEFTLSLRQRF